jgi:membrane protein DedA with SNARE-associated domain
MSDPLEAFLSWYGSYGYPILFLGVLLENAGVPVPGETAVLAAGFLASPASGGDFQLVWVIALASLAAVLGDNGGYWLGWHLARPLLRRRQSFLLLTPKRFEAAEVYFRRYGVWTIFLGRFVGGLRVVAAMVAGAASMSWLRFFLANMAGAVTWATAVSLLGYFFGRSWKVLGVWLGWGTWIVLGCLLLVVVALYLRKRLLKRPSQGESSRRAERVGD